MCAVQCEIKCVEQYLVQRAVECAAQWDVCSTVCSWGLVAACPICLHTGDCGRCRLPLYVASQQNWSGGINVKDCLEEASQTFLYLNPNIPPTSSIPGASLSVHSLSHCIQLVLVVVKIFKCQAQPHINNLDYDLYLKMYLCLWLINL